MSRASVGGVAALVTTGVGVVLVVVAGGRMLRAGDPGAAGSPVARLDLTATAVVLLGLAVVVGGVALALVALADRRLGRLEQDAPDASDATPGTTTPAGTESTPAPVARRPRPTSVVAPVRPRLPSPAPTGVAEESPAVR